MKTHYKLVASLILSVVLLFVSFLGEDEEEPLSDQREEKDIEKPREVPRVVMPADLSKLGGQAQPPKENDTKRAAPPVDKELIQTMEGCPEGWPLEVVSRNPDGSPRQQVCRSSENNGHWMCAEGWKADETAGNCLPKTVSAIMYGCPKDWPLEVVSRNDDGSPSAQVCRSKAKDGNWACAEGWKKLEVEGKCIRDTPT